ncbi:LysE family translocator [Thalassomonas viridans]|uniref:LysE family translocator n=1 Tax=Thalassomonas viridans TaxID=137584 RepID=A0AAF0C8G4_9GAMM|nr:LysE family translocator [Thalassomonas viridans]WDE04170.1 LysE family translocator [Thalassomonas viridans]
MELTAWLSLAAICLMGAMSPGPSLAMVLKHTVSGGRVNGVITALTHGAGVALYAVFTVMGLALIIKQTPWLFELIRYAGAAYLVWQAFKALTANSASAKLDYQQTRVTKTQSANEGFMIAFLNPKLAIFFLALFSQFIDVNANLVQKTIMVATVGGIDALWYVLIALILSQSALLTKLKNNVNIVEKITGVAFLLVAARIVL